MKNGPEKIRRVGIIGNSEKVSCASAVREAARIIEKSGRKLLCDSITAGLAGIEAEIFPDSMTLSRKSDLLLVFGGDGTMLRVAREIAGSRTPMLGINIGSLGFLTAVPSSELAASLQRVWKGEFGFENRVLLEGSGRCSGRLVRQSALNDLVVSRGIVSRLIELEVAIDGELLTTLPM